MEAHRTTTRPNRKNPLARRHWARVIELRVAGESVQAIADEIGVTHGPVSECLRLPEIRARIEVAHQQRLEVVQSKLAELATEAVDTLAAVMRNTDEVGAVRVKAATELLDRVGVVKAAKVEVAHTGQVEHRHSVVRPEELEGLTDEQFEELAARITETIADDDPPLLGDDLHADVWDAEP